MFKRGLRVVPALSILSLSITTNVAWAACPPNQLFNPLDPNCSGNFTIATLVGEVGVFLLAVAAPLCGIMVMIGGFQMMTAAGNPEKFLKGRKTLIFAALGFVIVLFSSGAAQLIKSLLNGS